MPTPEALKRLQQAKERMKRAQQEHLAFIENPDRGYSVEERTENRRLLNNVSGSIADYWEAFEAAARS
jgi:hypothetical protein